MERAADKQKVTDQNSLSESEQYPVPLGLVRLQEEKGEKSVVALQAKQMEHHAVLFSYFSLSSAFGRLFAGWACLALGSRNKADLSEALTCYSRLTCKSNLLSVPSTVRALLEKFRWEPVTVGLSAEGHLLSAQNWNRFHEAPKIRYGDSGLRIKEIMVISGDLGLWRFFVFASSKMWLSIMEGIAKNHHPGRRKSP